MTAALLYVLQQCLNVINNVCRPDWASCVNLSHKPNLIFIPPEKGSLMRVESHVWFWYNFIKHRSSVQEVQALGPCGHRPPQYQASGYIIISVHACMPSHFSAFSEQLTHCFCGKLSKIDITGKNKSKIDNSSSYLIVERLFYCKFE